MEKRFQQCDVLVIGAGATGLRAACVASQAGLNVLLVSSGACASPDVMGFNAATEPADSPDCFFEDLLAAGCGINNGPLIRVLAEGSRREIPFLEELGVVFDKKPDGSYHTLHTLGCSYPRLVHQGALTGGAAIQGMRRFCKDHAVGFEENVQITDLLLHNGIAAGAVGIHTKTQEFLEYRCKAVVLATGGAGAIQKNTTYPRSCAGDGYAIACRAGAELVDMEFQQFEPCAFVHPESLHGKIVPTTLLRSGAKLVNRDGAEFMEHYGLTRENARKGTLSMAIASEIEAGRGTPHGGVYYDMTMLPPETIIKGHSIFYEPAKAAGLDITQVPAEMAPAAHTFLGGIRIDDKCATAVPGLFAAGEVTGGLHGADRIGGCAGAETLVFGHIAGASATAYALVHNHLEPDNLAALTSGYQNFVQREPGIPVQDLIRQIGETMTKNAGILRNRKNLETALADIQAISEKLPAAYGSASQLYRCKNMLLVAEAQLRASLARKESRGVFNRTDFPQRDDANWKQNLIFRLENGNLVSRKEVPLAK